MADRPVRLTFPPREPGARKIMADGVQVGHALADHLGRWRAYCWAVADRPGYGFRLEVRSGSLKLLRFEVNERLRTDGPWWSDQAATG